MPSTIVATFHSKEYEPIAEITLPRLEAYCQIHGYDLYTEEYEGRIEKTIGWERFARVYDLLFSYETVMWVDADALITNPTVEIEKHLRGSVVMAADLHGANTGVFIARKQELVRQLFFVILGEYGRSHFGEHQWGEQAAFIHLTSSPPYNHLVRWVNQHQLNSYPNSEHYWPDFIQGNWEPGNFIIQFAGFPLARRIELAKKYAAMTEHYFK